MALLLCELGADVTGYALAPETRPSAYELLRIGERVREEIGDIRDGERLGRAVAAARPQMIVHMAAQPLVRRSFHEPIDTLTTNVLGTALLLEAIRKTPSVESVVVVTSDKVYANKEPRAMRENDPLGGDDPYSASKGCAEIVTASYRASYFGDGVHLATARAGNVIGGGDWSEDRLIPDLVRAATSGKPAVLRYPAAVRPWQHVADVVAGYALLAQRLSADRALARAWNFGPAAGANVSVGMLAERFLARYDSACRLELEAPAFTEKTFLALDSSAARAELEWTPHFDFEAAVAATADWYAAWRGGDDLRALTRAQLSLPCAQNRVALASR
jgi:CDP-glucose 4,6-dehydratase